MKILLTGSISVGKTTLFNKIPESDQILKIPEVARRILKDVPDLRLSPYFQRALLLEQYFLENEAKRTRSELIVCDRGYLDVVAYSRFFNHPIDEDMVSRFDPYDLVFYFHPEGTPPLLTEIPEEKERVDFHIRSLLSEIHTPVVTLRGPTDLRLELFYSTLLDQGIKPEGNIQKRKEA